MSRASSPLLFGLAPCGVCRASDVATGAVGSYPTFSPLPSVTCLRKTCRRFSCGLSPKRASHRRYVLCGTVRERVAHCRAKARLYTAAPLALPGALPFSPRPCGRGLECPDFPPVQPSCDGQTGDHPAHPPSCILQQKVRREVLISQRAARTRSVASSAKEPPAKRMASARTRA